MFFISWDVLKFMSSNFLRSDHLFHLLFIYSNRCNCKGLGSMDDMQVEIPLGELREMRLSFGNITLLYTNNLKNKEAVERPAALNYENDILFPSRQKAWSRPKIHTKRKNNERFVMLSNIPLDNKRISTNEVKNTKFIKEDYIKPLSMSNSRKPFLLRSRKDVIRRRKMQQNQEKINGLKIPSENELGYKIISSSDTRDTELYKQNPPDRQDASNSLSPFSRTLVLVCIHSILLKLI